jgi:hypothetical protein
LGNKVVYTTEKRLRQIALNPTLKLARKRCVLGTVTAQRRIPVSLSSGSRWSRIPMPIDFIGYDKGLMVPAQHLSRKPDFIITQW